MPPERVKRMKSELQLADLTSQTFSASKISKFTKKNATASATIKKCGPTAAVKLQKQRVDVSEPTMSEIRELSLFYI
jgi:hypothetical protein